MPTYEHKDGSRLTTPTPKPGLAKSKGWKEVDDKKKPSTGSSSSGSSSS